MFPPFVQPFGPASSDTTDLMFAPMVAAMRAPVMAWEMIGPNLSGRRKESEKAVFEKAAAIFETYGAVQTEIAHAWVKLWLASANGIQPDAASITKAMHDLMDASTAPSARRVKANYRRLLKED